MTHDPGGKVRIPIGDMSASAEFSPCGRYRHTLWRTWTPLREDAAFALWIGMNPSTADATHDDPTVRRMVNRTRAMGLESLCVCNVMDYRATNPRDLLPLLRLSSPIRARSPSNLPAISRNASVAHRVIVAFGSLPAPFRDFARDVVWMLSGQGIPLWCIGTTADGSPRHPLYVKSDAPLVRWGGWNG